ALHRDRALLQMLEDRLDRILDIAHHEAVEERRAQARAGASENATGGQELEPVERFEERLLVRAVPLDARDRRSDAPPRVVDRRLCGAVRPHVPVLRRPDVPGQLVVQHRSIRPAGCQRGAPPLLPLGATPPYPRRLARQELRELGPERLGLLEQAAACFRTLAPDLRAAGLERIAQLRDPLDVLVELRPYVALHRAR